MHCKDVEHYLRGNHEHAFVIPFRYSRALALPGRADGARRVFRVYAAPRTDAEVEKNILEFVSTQIAMTINRKRAENDLRLQSLPRCADLLR